MQEWLGSISTLVGGFFFFIFIFIYIVYGQEVCFIHSFFVKKSFLVLQFLLLNILKNFISKQCCYHYIMQQENVFLFYYGLLVSSTALCAISTSFSFPLEQILFFLSLLHHLVTSSQPYHCFGHPLVGQPQSLHKRQVHVVIFSFNFFFPFLSYLFCLKQHFFFFFFFFFLMDSLVKQKDYVVLSFIQSAYDDDMTILQASETYVSRFACFKILVNAMGTKMVFFF